MLSDDFLALWKFHVRKFISKQSPSGERVSSFIIAISICILFLMPPYTFLKSPLGSKGSSGQYDDRMKIMKNRLTPCPLFICKDFA